MIEGRWMTSLHEASHAVTAIALGGTCTRLAVYADDSGLALLDQLSPFDLAVSQAAAAAAEEILADELPPGPDPGSVPVRSGTFDVQSTVDLAVLASRLPRGEAISDDRAVALFCIAGLETEPNRWVDRFYLIHDVARHVVSDHHQQILSVARELFARGILSEHDILKELEKA